MAHADGTIRINTQVNTDGLAKGEKAIGASLGKIAKLAAGAFSIVALTRFGKECVDLASDLAEVQNVVDTSFGSMSYKMEEFANSAVKNFGMSKLTAKQMGSTFMSMAVGLGQSADIASDKAIELTARLGDISSFYNKSMEQVQTIGRAVYSGEAEPLKAIGVLMTQDNLKAYALQKGYDKLYTEMSSGEQLLVRQQYFLDKTSLSAGDFVKTQDSWANQTKILSEQWKEFMSVIGSGLITALTPAIKVLNNLVASLISMSKAIGATLANLFGIQVQSIDSIASSADGTEDATDAMNGYADATTKAGKAARGALASFDDLNVIQQASGSGGGGGASASSTIESSLTQSSDNALNQMQDKMSGIVDYVQKLGKAFTDGWNSAFKKLSIAEQLDNIKSNLVSIGDSLKEIFTDDDVMRSADNFLMTFAESIGKISASYVSIGLTIGQNVIGGIAKALDSQKGRIKTYLKNMFDISADISSLAGDFAVAFANVFSALGGENGQGVTSEILQIFGTIFGTVTELFAKNADDVLNAFLKPFSDRQEEFKRTLDEFLGVADGILERVRKNFEDFSDKLMKVYGESISPVFDDIQELVGELFDDLIALFDDVIKPGLDWIGQNVIPKLEPIVEFLENQLISKIGRLGIVLSGLVTIEKGLLEFTSGIFSKDWVKAWKGIEDVIIGFAKAFGFNTDTMEQKLEQFKDNAKVILNKMADGVERFANIIVDALNMLIDRVNTFSITVPDWVPKIGGNHWGIHIDNVVPVKLPRLANGGITTGSTLANIGEAGREAILPLENNMGYLDRFAEQIAEKMNGQNAPVYLQIDGQTFARLYNPYGKAEQNRIGLSFT